MNGCYLQSVEPLNGCYPTETVGRALRRAAKIARKTARMHGTRIYIWENGKVVPKSRKADLPPLVG